MTDQPQESGPTEDTEESPGQSGEGAASAFAAFTTGQGLVALAGIVILAVWLVFDVIADAYGLAQLTVVLGGAAAIVPRVDRAEVEKLHPLPVVMKTLGYAIVAAGVVEIVGDLEVGVYDDAGSILGALAAYTAFGLAFFGARTTST